MNIYDKMAIRNISDYCKQLSFIVSSGFIINTDLFKIPTNYYI